MTNFVVVHNARSGGGDRLEDIKKAFADRHVTPEYISLTTRGVRQALRRASEERDTIVVAAGGDGTVSAVAQYLHGTAGVLGVIPIGTLNHFAKTLNIPLDIEQAVDLILRHKPRAIDVGVVNKHVFVNNSSIGFYPRSLRIRDEYGHIVGKWPAATIGFVKSIIRPRHYRVTLHIEGQSRTFRTPFVFIGNNEYQRTQPDIGERRDIDKGLLAVYVIKATTPIGIIRSVAHALITKRNKTRDFALYLTDACTIETRHRRSINIACDGEVLVTRTPLRYRSEHESLRVLVPTKAKDESK